MKSLSAKFILFSTLMALLSLASFTKPIHASKIEKAPQSANYTYLATFDNKTFDTITIKTYTYQISTQLLINRDSSLTIKPHSTIEGYFYWKAPFPHNELLARLTINNITSTHGQYVLFFEHDKNFYSKEQLNVSECTLEYYNYICSVKTLGDRAYFTITSRYGTLLTP